VRVVIDVPSSAWYKALFDWGPWHETNEASVGFMDVANVAPNGCDPATGMMEPAVGPTVDDLVDAISAVPVIDVTRFEATLDGYSGVLLEMSAPDWPAGCAPEPTLWVTTGGDAIPLPGSDPVRAWILDVEGNRLVVLVAEGEGFGFTDELQALVDSIQIEAP
jgi:hypothetical protein